MRGPQLGRLARSAARSSSLRGLHTSMPAAAAAQPALAAAFALPASPSIDRPSGSGTQSASAGLSPQQAFAAHSLAQLGAAEGACAAGPSSWEVDEVALRLRDHLEAAFGSMASSPAPRPSSAPPAGMCAPLSGVQQLQSKGTGSASASLRSSAQAVAARLTKYAPHDMPHTLEAAMQPSQQARLVVEAKAPFRVCWANPAWEELSGLDFHDLTGEPCLEVVAGQPGPPAAAADIAVQLRGLAEVLVAHARGSATLNVAVGGSQSGAARVPVAVRITAIPLLNGDGSSTRTLLVFSPVQSAANVNGNGWPQVQAN